MVNGSQREDAQETTGWGSDDSDQGRAHAGLEVRLVETKTQALRDRASAIRAQYRTRVAEVGRALQAAAVGLDVLETLEDAVVAEFGPTGVSVNTDEPGGDVSRLGNDAHNLRDLAELWLEQAKREGHTI